MKVTFKHCFECILKLKSLFKLHVHIFLGKGEGTPANSITDRSYKEKRKVVAGIRTLHN